MHTFFRSALLRYADRFDTEVSEVFLADYDGLMDISDSLLRGRIGKGGLNHFPGSPAFISSSIEDALATVKSKKVRPCVFGYGVFF